MEVINVRNGILGGQKEMFPDAFLLKVCEHLICSFSKQTLVTVLVSSKANEIWCGF